MESDAEKGLSLEKETTTASFSSHGTTEGSRANSPTSESLGRVKTNRSGRSSIINRRLDGTDPYQNMERSMSAVAPDDEDNDDNDADDADGGEPTQRIRTNYSTTSGASRHPDFEVVFEEGDPENPRNWPTWYRVWMLFAISFSCWVTVLYSTTYASSTPGLMEEFGSSTTVTTLGLTTYLLGLAAGSVFLAPLSELFGRQPVYMVCLVIWAVLIVPSGVAKNLETIIVSRFFCAFFGAVMIANSPGSVVDISKPEYLALTFSMWCIAPMNAPSTGGIIGGFVFQFLGWRWSNWIVLIGGGGVIAMMATCKETYHPVILKRKAARMRKEMDDDRYWCQYEQQKKSISELLKVYLSRPFVLAATEPILWFLNIWISLVYGILYLCFVAYPIVFAQHRGWAAGVSGLAFAGMGIGTMMAILSEPLVRRFIQAQPRDPETGGVLPESTALVMGFGAIISAVGQLVFSWTCLPASIHWAAPMAASIPFGAGNTLIFIYGGNYIAGSYGIYAASALAGNAVIRSVFGGTLPLAGPKMYEALTPQWAGTLLGLLEIMMIPIPFIFWKYGAKIRASSRVIRQLREEQSRLDAKRARASERKVMAANDKNDAEEVKEINEASDEKVAEKAL